MSLTTEWDLSKRPKRKPDNGYLLKGLALVVVSLTIVVWISSRNRAPYQRPIPEVKTYDAFDALINSRKFIEEALVAPSTAKFDDSTKDTHSIAGKNTFRVKSFVDSQNGFGVMIRTYYSCRIQFLDDGRCYVDEVKIE